MAGINERSFEDSQRLNDELATVFDMLPKRTGEGIVNEGLLDLVVKRYRGEMKAGIEKKAQSLLIQSVVTEYLQERIMACLEWNTVMGRDPAESENQDLLWFNLGQVVDPEGANRGGIFWKPRASEIEVEVYRYFELKNRMDLIHLASEGISPIQMQATRQYYEEEAALWRAEILEVHGPDLNP